MYVHTPVLLNSVLSLLEPGKEETLFLDVTLGEGGHAEAFLKTYPGLRYFGVEADGEVMAVARERLTGFIGRVTYFHEWFTDFLEGFEKRFAVKPDRIFFDLGISMFHYERSGRGFSFRKDEPLDMRIDTDLQVKTAADIVNGYSGPALSELIERYGEEKMAVRIARAIVRRREKKPITSSKALAEIIRMAVPPGQRRRRHGGRRGAAAMEGRTSGRRHGGRRGAAAMEGRTSGRIHPATRTFQALRIAVNDELSRLEAALEDAFRVLSIGGRMGVISFHSLEDRIVKRFFKEKNKSCICPPESPICQCGGKRRLEILTRKPVRAAPGEIERNPASRSARLRVAEKLRESHHKG